MLIFFFLTWICLQIIQFVIHSRILQVIIFKACSLLYLSFKKLISCLQTFNVAPLLLDLLQVPWRSWNIVCLVQGRRHSVSFPDLGFNLLYQMSLIRQAPGIYSKCRFPDPSLITSNSLFWVRTLPQESVVMNQFKKYHFILIFFFFTTFW